MSTKFSAKQGQYLAFIYAYSKIHRQAPSEGDMRSFFGTSPPTIHSMVLRLEGLGLISRIPRTSRSIQLLVDAHQLPILE